MSNADDKNAGANFNYPPPDKRKAPVEMPPGREGTPIDPAVFNLPKPTRSNVAPAWTNRSK